MADKTSKNAGSVDAEPAGSDQPKHGFFIRLYTGTGAFEVVGKRRMWYAVSGVVLLIAVAAILLRGFSFGIEFEGGTKISMPRGAAEIEQVEQVFHDTLGTDPVSVVIVGNGPSATVQVRSENLDNQQTADLRQALFDRFQPIGDDGQPSPRAISDSAVSETWGGQITEKALIALVVFLAIVGVYIAVRYERYMAVAALLTLVFDLVVTAGVYALVGFEVTPATVIGWLTILGFSLYDTVIVFDKVEENTQGFEHTTRRTFAEQVNLAINQTFMRSLNTAVISVLPIIALMVIAVWLLGVGTLQDLALVQLVGVVVGTYSSIYFATLLLVSMRERTEKVRVHTRRVMNRRNRAAGPAATTDAVTDAVTDSRADAEPADAEPATVAAPSAQPGPAARPSRPTRTAGRPTGKRSPRRS